MDLYLYPEAMTNKDGYGIGVSYAYKRETPKKEDVVVWLTTYPQKEMENVRENDYILKRKRLLSFKSLWNIVRGRIRSELNAKDLSFIRGMKFENIHCDDVVFYKALRQLYPNQYIRLRLHNCFSRIAVRNQFLKREIGWKYEKSLKAMSTLEKEIFDDEKIFKIFISDEDRDFYRSIYGVACDSETWQYMPDMDAVLKHRKNVKFNHKLVWFGGVEAHKESSIHWFISEVLPKIKECIPDVEFHLWGKNTLQFDQRDANVFAHGFYDGDGMPLLDCLYVNPDIIGGGIKLKLMSMMENGVPFISTPFGFEGYKNDLKDNTYCIVEEESKWANRIIQILS